MSNRTIAERLAQMAENEPVVYNTGYNNGYKAAEVTASANLDNISATLDNIIEIQNSLIGGGV